AGPTAEPTATSSGASSRKTGVSGQAPSPPKAAARKRGAARKRAAPRKRAPRKPTASSTTSAAASNTPRKRGRPKPSDRRLPTTKEVSAGGVVYRRGDEDDIEVVLASRRTRRGDLAWGLAKGGIEAGESREAAAVREVREETGLIAEIEADLGDTKYMYV